MDQIIQILSVVALIAFIVIAFVLTSTLKAFFATMTIKIDLMQKDISSLNTRLGKSLDNMDALSKQAEISLKESEESIKNIGELAKNINAEVEELSGALRPYTKLASDFYEKVQRPISTTGAVFSGLQKALSVFMSRMK